MKARIVGAREAAQRFERAADRLRHDVERAVSEVAQDSELIFAGHALRKSGRMARGIAATSAGTTALVHAHAQNPETGFDYVGVTRFGHRARIIRPVRAKALRIPVAGGFIFRKSVRGFHPKEDWAARASPEVERGAQDAVRRIGREISVRIA